MDWAGVGTWRRARTPAQDAEGRLLKNGKSYIYCYDLFCLLSFVIFMLALCIRPGEQTLVAPHVLACSLASPEPPAPPGAMPCSVIALLQEAVLSLEPEISHLFHLLLSSYSLSARV